MYTDYNMYNNYYGLKNYSVRQEDMGSYDDELISLAQAIDLIRISIMDEKKDESFYSLIMEQAPTEEEKNIIMSIRDNERKHNSILRNLYYNFTGQMIPMDYSQVGVESGNDMSYTQNLEKALFGELDAVEKYRRILGTMPSGDSYTLIMSILTDELRHASKYNYLIHKASLQNNNE